MAKVRFNLSIDQDVHAAAKARGMNVSNECNNFLRRLLLSDTDYVDPEAQKDAAEARVMDLKRKLAEAENERSRLTSAARLREEEEERRQIEEGIAAMKALKQSGEVANMSR